jgi:hypothetical protein
MITDFISLDHGIHDQHEVHKPFLDCQLDEELWNPSEQRAHQRILEQHPLDLDISDVDDSKDLRSLFRKMFMRRS